VIEACRACGVPVAITLGGGYAEDVADTVAIHVETVLSAARLKWATGERRAAERP
jgi:acetoin utilization deacetylase AcuC-like enzyme